MIVEAVFSPVHLLAEKNGEKKVFAYFPLPLMRVHIFE